VRTRQLWRRAEAGLDADVLARGYLRVGDGGADLLVRGRARLVHHVGVGRVEAAADVVVGDRRADGGAAQTDGDPTGKHHHHRRLDRLQGDRALRVDRRVADVGVDVVGDRVDGDRAAQRESLAARRRADGNGDQNGAGRGREIEVAPGRHGGVVDVGQDRVLDQVVADRRADRGALRGSGDA